MAWTIEFEAPALKDLKGLDRQIAARIVRKLENEVALNPCATGKPLRGSSAGVWRWRIGDYRVLGSLEDDRLVIAVIGVGHRREIYR